MLIQWCPDGYHRRWENLRDPDGAVCPHPDGRGRQGRDRVTFSRSKAGEREGDSQMRLRSAAVWVTVAMVGVCIRAWKTRNGQAVVAMPSAVRK